MRRIFSLLLIGILFSQDENNNFTFIIYPELVGVGGAPSINIEFPVSEYSIRVGVGMVVMQAELYPIIIYKSTGKTRSKSEIGAGLIFIDDGDEMDIGLVSSMNWKKVSKSGPYLKVDRAHLNSPCLTYQTGLLRTALRHGEPWPASVPK